MNRGVESALLVLQGLQVAFLLLHDWVPLGRLNDVAAVRRLDPLAKRLRVTLLSALPFLLGLTASCVHARDAHYPGWLLGWLRWSYGLLFAGQLWAWWIPYLLRPDPARAARYQVMFGNTHCFLAKRNGMAPNTLHIALHLATLSTLLLLLRL